MLAQGAMVFLNGECGDKFGKNGRNGTGEKKGAGQLGPRAWLLLSGRGPFV